MIALISAAWSVLSDKLKAAIALIGGFFVGALLTWLVMTISYNGISLPFIGQLVDGRVQTAVKTSNASLVSSAEIVSSHIETALAKQQLQRISDLSAKASEWGANEDATAASDKAKLETENATAPKDGSQSAWTDADVERLRKWRSSQD